MTLFMRIIFFGLIGILAGILSWPFAELLIFFQAHFPSLLLFSILLGLAIGFSMGFGFGSIEGIVSNSWHKIKSGIIMGLVIGAAGGIVGFVTGQAALLLIGTKFFNSMEGFKRIGLPLSKAIGWDSIL